MAFEKVNGGKFVYVKYKDCTAGQVLAEGTYLGSKEGTYGTQYQFRANNGTITVLNSAGHLDYWIENGVKKGEYTRVTYTGTEPITKGKYKGKDSHQFEVEVDKERGIDSSAQAVNTTSSQNSSDEDNEDVVDETDEFEDEAETQVAPPVSTISAPKAKESTQDVLNKYRNQSKKAS